MFLNSKKCFIVAFLVLELLLTQTVALKCWVNQCLPGEPETTGCKPDDILPKREVECKSFETLCVTGHSVKPTNKVLKSCASPSVNVSDCHKETGKTLQHPPQDYEQHTCVCKTDLCNSADCCNCDGACPDSGSSDNSGATSVNPFKYSVQLWSVVGMGSFLMMMTTTTAPATLFSR